MTNKIKQNTSPHSTTHNSVLDPASFNIASMMRMPLLESAGQPQPSGVPEGCTS